MKAIILAGGKGSRLYPFSAVLPKPLMPLGEMPVLELLLRQLAHAGVDHAILAVNHMRHLIEAFFGDGSRFGLRIEYSGEDKPLGTAGPMGAVLDRMDDDFVLVNGDLLTTLDIGQTVASCRSPLSRASGGSRRRDDRGVRAGSEGRIRSDRRRRRHAHGRLSGETEPAAIGQHGALCSA